MKNRLLLIAFLVSGILGIISCSEDDAPITFDVTFSPASLSIAENAGPATVTLSLPAGMLNDDAVVTYEVSGTAIKDTDYTISATSPITIPAGSTTATFTVTPIDNLEGDGARTVIVTITGVTFQGVEVMQGTLAQTYTLTITDDECSPYIEGTWSYEAIYFSLLGSEEIPAANNGQGLLSEFLEDGVTDNPDHEDGTPSIENPEFTGTIEIEDENSERSYSISDAVVGQFSGITFAAPGDLFDDCGDLSTPTGEDQILLLGALYVSLTGEIVDDNTINVSWNVYADAANTILTNKGSATLTKN